MAQAKRDEYFRTSVILCFDPDFIDCKHCPLLETYSRETCRLTGELIPNNKCVGNHCPFIDEVIDYQTNKEIERLKQEER